MSDNEIKYCSPTIYLEWLRAKQLLDNYAIIDALSNIILRFGHQLDEREIAIVKSLLDTQLEDLKKEEK